MNSGMKILSLKTFPLDTRCSEICKTEVGFSCLCAVWKRNSCCYWEDEEGACLGFFMQLLRVLQP